MLRTAVAVACVWLLAAGPLSAQVGVLTNRYDNSRDGLNSNETLLNSANVNVKSFGKLFTYNVDGHVVAQPLYVPNLAIPGNGTRNVVFVATQHDSVYAFDADSPGDGTPLWQASFVNPAAGVTTVPIAEQGCGVVNGYSEVGIQGTPVIDLTTDTLYVSAKTKEVSGSNTTYVHRLHALDLATGQEKFGGPVVVSATIQGPLGAVTFNSFKQMQRPGLLLSNGVVYLSYGSNGCDGTVGWIFAYDASSLQQLGVFDTAPGQIKGASVWQGGSGPAADSSNDVYLFTANGAFDVNTGGFDFGDTFLRLHLGVGGLSWADYFTPDNQLNMATHDLDLGSGGPTLLPDQPGSYPHLAVGAGKTGEIYLVNRDSMGGYQSSSNNQIVQWIPGQLNEVDGSPTYWNNLVYFAANNDAIKAFSLADGLLSTVPVAQSQPFSTLGSPAVSANGDSNGLLWLVRNGTAPMLSVFDALSLNEIYNSQQNSSRDGLGNTTHFPVVTVANGKAYSGTQSQLAVYGLLPQLKINGGNNQVGAAGTQLPGPLTIQAVDAYNGSPLSNVMVTFSDGNKGGSFSPPSSMTNGSGVAGTMYTLPTKAGVFTITASATNFASALLQEKGVAGAPASLSLFSGGSQSGTVGTQLPSPVVVKVKDAYGNFVTGVAVSFTDNGALGGFSANPVTTDSLGRATVNYTLPTKARFITITASNSSLSLNVNAHAVAGAAASLSIVSGNRQSAPRGTQLPRALGVAVRDQYGNAVAGVLVSFSDGGAGGTFSNGTANTNASGQASVTYTLPSQPGMLNITATVTTLTPVVFTEKGL